MNSSSAFFVFNRPVKAQKSVAINEIGLFLCRQVLTMFCP